MADMRALVVDTGREDILSFQGRLARLASAPIATLHERRAVIAAELATARNAGGAHALLRIEQAAIDVLLARQSACPEALRTEPQTVMEIEQS